MKPAYLFPTPHNIKTKKRTGNNSPNRTPLSHLPNSRPFVISFKTNKCLAGNNFAFKASSFLPHRLICSAAMKRDPSRQRPTASCAMSSNTAEERTQIVFRRVENHGFSPRQDRRSLNARRQRWRLGSEMGFLRTSDCGVYESKHVIELLRCSVWMR